MSLDHGRHAGWRNWQTRQQQTLAYVDGKFGERPGPLPEQAQVLVTTSQHETIALD